MSAYDSVAQMLAAAVIDLAVLPCLHAQPL